MKKELDKNIENNEDVKKIKSKYKRIIKSASIILIIILLIFLINFIRTYSEFSKILKTNIAANLGENYKVITYTDGNSVHTYCKNGVKKIIRNIGKPSEIITIQTKDKSYAIAESTKTYWDVQFTHNEVNKIDLISSIFCDEEYLTPKDFIRVMLTEKVKIDKEEYNGKDYIILNIDMIKIWVNPDTYYIEREIRFGEETQRIIEKNVVTDKDVEIPNLEGYEYQEIDVFPIR